MLNYELKNNKEWSLEQKVDCFQRNVILATLYVVMILQFLQIR